MFKLNWNKMILNSFTCCSEGEILHESDMAAFCQTAPIQPTKGSSECSQLSLALVRSLNQHFLSFLTWTLNESKNRAHQPDSRCVWERNDGPRTDVTDYTDSIQGLVAKYNPADHKQIQLSRYLNYLWISGCIPVANMLQLSLLI